MPDQRKHRGPHPQDRELFRTEVEPVLGEAMRDLSWLWTRGYAADSSLKLVGDRYSLTKRQRLAIARCACGDDRLSNRQQHRVTTTELRDRELWIDGYNVLTSIEAALAKGVILHARDGCYRDMASMHGSYRKVEETLPAIHLLGSTIQQWNVRCCRWFLDRPVSNSGRLRALLLEAAQEHRWNWQVDLVNDPDAILKQTDQTIATADSQILDSAHRWFNLARTVIDQRIHHAWILHLP